MIRLQNKNNLRNSRLARLGVTAVEFACVAPVFIFVIAVCVEFARLSMMRNLAQNAAYEASRFIIAEGATANDGIARANQILGRLGTKNATILINGNNGAGNNNITASTENVTCRIDIPLAANSLIIPASLLGNNIVATSTSLRTERYDGYYDGVSTN